ncbi:MAG: GTPase [archaeon]
MDFQGIRRIENLTFYTDQAFSAARKAKQNLSLSGSKLDRARSAESKRILTATKVIQKNLTGIIQSFPTLNNLDPFYLELVKITIDFPVLKKSLGALQWAVRQVDRHSNEYHQKVQKCPDARKISSFRKSFYGRAASILRQISDNLSFLEHARRVMRNYPVLKEGLTTVVIAGFPNVGKTTLLHKLTESKPEIKPYPFTTKSINIGYIQTPNQDIQVLDTPGFLDRTRLNPIEQQSALAIKYFSDILVYVFDLTEPYPLKDQMELYKKLCKGKHIAFLSRGKGNLPVEHISSPEELKRKIIEYCTEPRTRH